MDGRGGNGIEGLDIVDVTNSLVMVASDHGNGLESSDFLDDIVGGCAVAHQISQKEIVVDFVFLAELQKSDEGFQISVDISKDKIAHVLLYPLF